MASLILLNGPPGIGKSTMSARWVDRHDGTLNLDIDRLHRLVGGWQDESNHTHEVLRPVALAMASAHLAGGRDVILPQYLGHLGEVQAFERVAHEHRADFREIILLEEKVESITRFHRRTDAGEWDELNRRLVAQQGGSAFLAGMYDQLLELLRLRAQAVIVRSRRDEFDATYAAIEHALVSI